MDPDLTYPEGRKALALMPNGMSWLTWCPNVSQIKHQSFKNEYWILKIPGGGKKILCLSGLMLRSNQFYRCAMTSLVMTSVLDKYWICNITPEGEALMLNLLWHCIDSIPVWSIIEQAPPPLPCPLPLLPPRSRDNNLFWTWLVRCNK